MTTLTDLLQPRDRPTIEALLMAVLQTAPIDGMPGVSFPVTDWTPGSFERTHMKMIATGFADRENMIQFLTASGFLQLAATLVDANGTPVEGWMELLASQNYLLNRSPAGYTQQLLTLTCTSGPGPYTRNPGEIVALAPSTGNRYTNVSAVTIPDGGSVTAVFQADGPGVGYLDPMGSIIALTTPLPGVSVNNAATPAGVPASYLTGSGSLAVTSSTITSNVRTVKIAFTTSGRVGDHSAQFTVTVYTGSSVVTSGPFSAVSTYTQEDATITFTDGGSGTQSFNAGDEWIVGLPGTPILQSGSEKETLQSLAQRCMDRWPALSVIPTGNRFEGMVRECEAAQHLGVVKVYATPSPSIAGVENVYIAGSTSTASPAQVADVQGYLDQRAGLIDVANVIAANAVSVAVGGNVFCRRGTIPAVQAAVDLGWAKYITGLAIGGEQPSGVVKLLALDNVINASGAFNGKLLTLNGYPDDVTLTPDQCATISAAPSTTLNWLEVA